MAQIEAEGALSFLKFFNLALYHPEWGYYAQSQRPRTGKEGDFFTAVSVGSLFGRIVADYAYQAWKKEGRPALFRLVEWGAEQGDWARDILAGAAEIGDGFPEALRYAVVEPLPSKREALQARLPEATVVSEAADLEPERGLVIANELIDALSFWLIRWEDGHWWERRVVRASEAEAAGDEGKEAALFVFKNYPPEEALAERLALVEGSFCEGYESEIRPSLAPLLGEMKSVLRSGEILLFDYGFERGDLYHPSRTTGTLRTFGNHQAAEDPLVSLGQIDITAHVDFTALAEDACAVGLQPQPLESQGRFLTLVATELLQAREGQVDPEFMRQFQTLTHPHHLGSKFSLFRAKILGE